MLTFNGQPTKEAAQTSCDMVHTNMPCGLMGRSTTEKLPQRKRLPCFITGSQSLRYRTQRNDKPAQSCGIRLLRRTQKDLVPRVPRIDAYNIVISTPTGRQDGFAQSVRLYVYPGLFCTVTFGKLAKVSISRGEAFVQGRWKDGERGSLRSVLVVKL